ncbi:hypothetical protein ACFFV7_36060 [Nonomuraea spiralis]|uniref:Uncharacterized protein n=1 Tax=Nonomuraea spiralis TaxID=46182 RepID=A0ABV5IQ69_9ACTN|nr:hypothetical protein [Nonomuraea spiralis]GGT11528.1 hypothetical protein GCM10010176_065270 [Nonomuraea spiralis]
MFGSPARITLWTQVTNLVVEVAGRSRQVTPEVRRRAVVAVRQAVRYLPGG